MNKKRIAQILIVLILLSNVNFQPNLIYADEIIGNGNIASGSNLDKEKREAVKTGDNLFTKLTLFTTILSIFGLSYLQFLKKKKIEINSED